MDKNTDERMASRSASEKKGVKTSHMYGGLPDDLFDDLNVRAKPTKEEVASEERAAEEDGATY